MKGKKECKICFGTGRMTVANGRSDFDIEDCFCTIAYKVKVKQIV